MQVLPPKRTQFSEGRHDIGLDLFETAKNTDALFLSKLVEFSAENQLLQLLRERLAVDCRLQHLKAPQRDHLADKPCLGDTRDRHAKDVALLGL